MLYAKVYNSILIKNVIIALIREYSLQYFECTIASKTVY